MHARPLDLDDDLPAIRQNRRVDLPDRRRSERLCRERSEERVDGSAELELDLFPDLLEGRGRHLILKLGQLRDVIGRQDIGPRREKLAEFDEGRAELLQGEPEMDGTLANGSAGPPVQRWITGVRDPSPPESHADWVEQAAKTMLQ
jgi:hypothetical protein